MRIVVVGGSGKKSAPSQERDFTDLESKETIALYYSGVSLEELVWRFDCNKSTVAKHLTGMGLKISSYGRKKLSQDEEGESNRRKPPHEEKDLFVETLGLPGLREGF